MPSPSAILALQPSAFIFETSSSLRGVPSGIDASQEIFPL
jgi:hypothetical protein